MKRKLISAVAVLLLAVLVAAACFVYAESRQERPTLMYFRADL
jgi:hypothetical protein